MQTTHPTQFIRVEHDEFEGNTSIYAVYADNAPIGECIHYESSKDGELWYYRYYKQHSSDPAPEKIILRCNDSYNIILNKSKSVVDGYDFEMSDTDAKRIAASTTMKVRVYTYNENEEFESFLSEYGINQHSCIFATHVIFNYLDNSLYSENVKEYAQQEKKYFAQKQAQEQAMQAERQARKVAERNLKIFKTMLFIGGLIAFWKLGETIGWTIPIFGVIAVIVVLAKW